VLSKRCKPPPVEAAAASFANSGYAGGEVRRRRKVSARVGFASEIATFDSTVSSTPCSGTGDPYKVRWGDFITSEEDIPRRIPPFRGKRRLRDAKMPRPRFCLVAARGRVVKLPLTLQTT
jgi:hypothetical protein